ncbi:MAG: extracellular solute-binding protein [Phycisphaerae bacterium]|nr:extracellular solute-binding protein [Phycisphaerae bacterium]
MRLRLLDVILVVVVLAVLGLMAYTPRPPERRPDGRTIVTYWEKWTKFEGEAIKHVVERFNAIPGNTIYVKLMTVSDIQDKVKVASAGGDPPDVTGLYNFNVASFADQNALVCLDDLCREHGLNEGHYIPVYWQMCQHRGHTWALPTTPATVALHVNRKMLRSAGLPDRFPETIAELDEWAERLTVVRVRVNGKERECSWKEFEGLSGGAGKSDKVEFVDFVQMGFLPTEPGWFNWGLCAWFGGKLMDPERGITADDPGDLAALEWFCSYAEKYGLNRIDRFQGGFGNFSSPENAFFNGKIAMELQGVWLANFIAQYAPKGFDWDAGPFPAVKPTKDPITEADADVICIPAGSRHPREAFQFIAYLQSQEGMELLCREQWKHSPLSKVSAAFYASHPNKRIKLFYDLAWSPNVMTRPRIGVWEEYEKVLTTAYDNAWQRIETPRQALAVVQRHMTRRYAAELVRLERLGARP